MKKSIFVYGFGYTAKALVVKLEQSGIDWMGTSRQDPMPVTGQKPIKNVIRFNAADLEDYLSKAQYLLISTPPLPKDGDPVLFHYDALIRKYAPRMDWVGYLSSTSVYGDHQGKWVDEDSPCNPLGISGMMRMQAEQAWLTCAKENHIPLHIFRLAGIYGPKRNALQRIYAGKEYSVFKEGQFFSRIHVDDIASVLLASMQAPNPWSVYNVADDEPAPSHVVDTYACSLLDRSPLPLVPLEQAALSPMEKDFYANNRRVSNLKIKHELNVCLQYPSFREGLEQIWKDEFS